MQRNLLQTDFNRVKKGFVLLFYRNFFFLLYLRVNLMKIKLLVLVNHILSGQIILLFLLYCLFPLSKDFFFLKLEEKCARTRR